MKKISFVIPFYNEGENLRKIYDELLKVSSQLPRYAVEYLFMDNHSTDNSQAVVKEIAAKNPQVTVVRLSRNFGFQANILSGLLLCTGDAAIQIDADGEDDPTLILEFIHYWEQGYKVVYGIRKKRNESIFLTFQRKIFYRILNFLSSIPIPLDSGDFRLLDRKVIECLKSFKEANPYLRGIISYAGFNQIGVSYNRRPRYDGVSKFKWWDYFQLAWDGITSFSRKPLALATWIGFGFAFLSFSGMFVYLLIHLFIGTRLPGFTTIVLFQLFLAGIQLICLGVLGAYISRIFEDVKNRPRSIIEEVVSLDKTSESIQAHKNANTQFTL